MGMRLSSILGKLRASKIGWIILVTLFAVFVGVSAVVISGILSLPWILDEASGNADVALGVAFPVALIGLSLLVSKIIAHKKGVSYADILGWRKPKKNIFKLVLLALVIYIVTLLVALTVLQLLSPDLAQQEQDVALTVSSLGGIKLFIMFISVAVLTPIAEETFFRGILLWLYSKRLKIPAAILTTAVLFGLAHGQLNVGIDTFLFGLMLGYLAWKTESIYPTIALHMLKNTIALGVILNWRFF